MHLLFILNCDDDEYNFEWKAGIGNLVTLANCVDDSR